MIKISDIFYNGYLYQYWKLTDNRLDWMDIENAFCVPFSAKEKQGSTTNPILAHAWAVWAKVHQMHRMSHYMQPHA